MTSPALLRPLALAALLLAPGAARAADTPLFQMPSVVTATPAAPLDATAIVPVAPGEAPTELRAERLEMTSSDTETFALATGNVIVTGTNLRITCDRLEMIAARIGGDRTATVDEMDKIKYLLAIGNVRIVQGDREATCGRAEVFPKDEKVILTEAPVVVDHSSKVVATGTRLTLLRGKREIIGENVRVTAAPIQDLGADAKPRPAPR